MILLSGCSNTSEEVETIEEYSVVIIEDSVIEAEEVIKEPIIEAIEPIEAIETPVVEEPIENTEPSGETMVFKATAYCPCSKCCGKWAGGNTASGTTPTAGRTIAVDTSVIPFGTKIIINGITYIAEDTGSLIEGNRIDIFFDSHEEALQFGVQQVEGVVVWN